MVEVKVCGVTSVSDAVACVEAGVSVLGVNFWPGTPRCCPVDVARAMVDALGARVLFVGVYVDATSEEIRRTRDETGISWAQLHGEEPPEAVSALLPHAYKALGAADRSVLARAATYPGEHLLLDAAVPGLVGGTGRTFDWDLAAEVARTRKLTLAGGLRPENVGEAIRRVRPHRVDVASGVERAPGVKDPERVRAFVAAARAAGAST